MGLYEDGNVSVSNNNPSIVRNIAATARSSQSSSQSESLALNLQAYSQTCCRVPLIAHMLRRIRGQSQNLIVKWYAILELSHLLIFNDSD
jgi:HD-like signal output (HDOD) protein